MHVFDGNLMKLENIYKKSTSTNSFTIRKMEKTKKKIHKILVN